MTLQQLRYAVAVTECGSISEAAKNLFITQPSLTHAIKELENELHITLFIRNNKGILLSHEGEEFIGYARQVLEQQNLLEEKYMNRKPAKQHYGVSTHHYTFAVNAFLDLVHQFGDEAYDYSLREEKTFAIIENVATLKSNLGVLYLNDFNEAVIRKLLRERELTFELLFIAKPHVFLGSRNPLATRKSLDLKDLEPYPYLCFDQGEYNSFYFAEEILSTRQHQKTIKVTDRATMSNLIVGMNGYTVCSGLLGDALNGNDMVSIPLDLDEEMRIGVIERANSVGSRLSDFYKEALLRHCKTM